MAKVMKINVQAVLQREAERKAEVKPLPKVRILSPGKESPAPGKPIPSTRKSEPVNEKEILLKDLWNEFSTIQKNRNKLSTRTATLVDGILKKLQKEGSIVAKAFLNGEIAVPALKEHYAMIQERTEGLKALYDKILHVEKYGTLPQEKPMASLPDEQSPNVKELNYEIRRMDDLIHKTRKKMEAAKAGIKAPKNSDRFEQWNIKIGLAEAKRDDLKKQLSRIRHESGEQCTGA